MILSTDALFLVSVNKTHVLSAIMLPNTKHIKSAQKKIDIRNKINDVIAFHRTTKITTGHLSLDADRNASMHLTSKNKPKSITQEFYSFQKAYKRFNEIDLMSDEGVIRINPRQKEYLESKLIAHAWVSLHGGHAVGLITYPLIKNSIMHDQSFEIYKSLARTALQQFGYVVACDLVVDHNNNLKLYNIHSEYEVKGKVIPYFTRQIPTTSHLSFKPVSD